MQNRRNPRTNPSGHRDNTVSEENVASTGHSRKAQMPESRINVEDMTPDRVKDTSAGGQEAANQGTAHHKDNGRDLDDGKAKGGVQAKSVNDQEKGRMNGQKDSAGFSNV